MSEKAQKIFNNVVTNNQLGSAKAFGEAIRDKLNDALEVRKVGLTSEIFNKATVKESVELEEAKLEEPESKKDLVDLLKRAKQIRGVTDDEYMSWYGNMDDKLFLDWDKMVKKDSNYKNAYQLGVDGGSDKNLHKKGTLAAAIWADQYASGAMDA
jgi:hypothetical protein